jgi:polysaccharide pyruvyl transferase WcaK-like protein
MDNSRPRILVEPSGYACLNIGDIAMLQVTVSRLRALWPLAEIRVFTSAPDRLAAYCPSAVAVPTDGRRAWFNDRYLFGPLDRLVPKRGRARLLARARAIRRRHPRLAEALLRCGLRIKGRNPASVSDFLRELRSADLLVVSGGGSITDAFGVHALNLLEVLAIVHGRGTPTALFGQGLGPADDPRLRQQMAAVLPSARLLALREDVTGQQFIGGRMPGRVLTTGDDAIELAYSARRSDLGNAIGVNLRIADYSEIEDGMIAPVGTTLVAAARKYRVALVPVPIAMDRDTSDVDSVVRLLGESFESAEGARDLRTPLQVIEQVGRCRVLVTGSYHAAVFALSQGIPAICLAGSAYYRAKFQGLAAQFATGCEVVHLDNPDLAVTLPRAIDRAWDEASTVRPTLLDAAVRQIALSHSAYRRLYEELTRKTVRGLSERGSAVLWHRACEGSEGTN